MLRTAILATAAGLMLGAPVAAQGPAEKAALTASIFADLCARALPDMAGLEDRVRALTADLFANSGGIDQPGVYVQGGSIATSVGFSVATPAWRDSDGQHFCQTTVHRINRAETVDRVVAAFSASKPNSVGLTPVSPAPRGMLAAWTVSGAKPGMVLQARRADNSGVQFRLAWKG